MRLAAVLLLLAVAGCRAAPPALTTSELQGDWILKEDSVGYAEVSYSDIIFGARTAFAVRGDSAFDPFLTVYAHMGRSEMRVRDTLRDASWESWSRAGDTLIHQLGGGRWERFERLSASPDAPRPERIAIRFGGCYMGCSVMDAEIDSSGTFWYLDGDDAEPIGRFVAYGRYDLYDRLSTLAMGLRLDRQHPEVSGSPHALSTLLVAWYGGQPHVFDGTADEFGPLLLVVSEMANAAWTSPMEETSVRHRFANRDVLDHQFLSYPEVIREVFGE